MWAPQSVSESSPLPGDQDTRRQCTTTVCGAATVTPYYKPSVRRASLCLDDEPLLYALTNRRPSRTLTAVLLQFPHKESTAVLFYV